MGKGYCPTGYYRGWDLDADHATMDAEKCAILCNEEPECLYFSVRPFKTCSRYNSGAGDCPIKSKQHHELYKKIGKYTMYHVHCGPQIFIGNIIVYDLNIERYLHFSSMFNKRQNIGL